jgi:DNA-binding CsgD family transcriptional regulator
MEGDESRLKLGLAIILLGIIAAGTVDLVLDAPASWLTFHVLFELTLIAAALVTVTALWLGWRRDRRAVYALRASLAERQRERDAWRAGARTALAGLGEAMDRQFAAWRLTPAERDVAFALLKGHSHKAIAVDSGRSERTVRQHAAAVYQKAGLGSRAELAAFFLEDVMLPGAARPADSTALPEP